jgi:hypothetical protein
MRFERLVTIDSRRDAAKALVAVSTSLGHTLRRRERRVEPP